MLAAGLYTTPKTVSTPFFTSPIDTAKIGRLCVKLVVPSRGSITHRYSLSVSNSPRSSDRIECPGKASCIFLIINSSDSISAFVTKSILV